MHGVHIKLIDPLIHLLLHRPEVTKDYASSYRFDVVDPAMSVDEDGGGGYATVGASRRAARL